MAWARGLPGGALSLLREIHATGMLSAGGADSTFCGPGFSPLDSDQHRQMDPAAVARRLDEGGFEVVSVPSMRRVAGPFGTAAAAAEAAAILNMEKRAERADATAIKRLAKRAEQENE